MFPSNDMFVKRYESYPATAGMVAGAAAGAAREFVDRGGKMIMPPSALAELAGLDLSYPLLFRVTSGRCQRASHCGVQEFTADEGRVYLPRWMMTCLLLDPGDVVSVETVLLPVATHAKIRPLSADFIDISDSKAVLENTLRSFACLTAGDVIDIYYNSRVYEVCVLETQPGDAVCIIECDMSVEFVAPPGTGREEPLRPRGEEDHDYGREGQNTFVPFSGEGNILHANKRRKRSLHKENKERASAVPRQRQQRGVPDYNYTVGVLQFTRRDLTKNMNSRSSGSDNIAKDPFSGPGYSLKSL